jgi:hypothetical protein
MPFADEGYSDEEFWDVIGSASPAFLGFWTHR